MLRISDDGHKRKKGSDVEFPLSKCCGPFSLIVEESAGTDGCEEYMARKEPLCTESINNRTE